MTSAIRRDISEKGFQDILEKSFFVVPAYQRSYSWEEYNLSALWDDIVAARSKRLVSGDNGYGNHFMSSILIKDGEDDLKYIVDGQQRLITITLFLHAALSLMEDEGDEIYEAVNDALYGMKRETDALSGKRVKVKVPRIVLKNQPEDNAYSVLITKGADAWNDSHKSSKVYNNYWFFVRKLRETLSQSAMGNTDLFHETIMTVLINLRIIYIPMLANESPQKIFESVNGLTKELFAGELIKNYLLMSTANESFTDSIYQKYWAVFDEPYWTKDDVQKEKFTKLLYYWVSSKGIQLKSSDEAVYRAFKSYANLSSIHDSHERHSKVNDISKDLNFSLIEHERLENNKINPTDRFSLFYTRIFSGKQANNAKSILMLYMNISQSLNQKYGKPLTEEELDILIQPVESFIVRKIFSKTGYNSSCTKLLIDTIYHVLRILPDDINGAKDYVSKFSNEIIKELKRNTRTASRWETNENVFDYLCGNPSKGILPKQLEPIFHSQARMMIIQIENFNQSKNLFKASALHFGDKDYTLEHWMPQQAKEDDWPLYDSSLRSIYTYCLGNMAIITQSLNSELSNHSLVRKLHIIEEHLKKLGETSTGLKNLDWIIDKSTSGNTPEWSEDFINERSRWIVQTAFTKIFRDSDSFL